MHVAYMLASINLMMPLVLCLQADIEGVLEQLNMWCQCMHGAAGAVAG